ncbi:MAG TPA: ATP-binding protein [Cyclobacteriaceae bacterium]|nr:ATP-binding protein [Cyclobacteriaceae bacterium]
MEKNNPKKIKKIVIIGPECTGKSELSEYLSRHFNTCWVPEYARTYLDILNTPYQESDLMKIAHGQIKLEDEWLPEANKILICDTNLLVIKVWSNFKYGRCNEEILQMIKERTYDLYLLTYIDIPWQEDPQREHPDKREVLMKIYKEELEQQSVPVVEIKGEREERRANAIKAIEQLLKDND